MRRTLIGVGLVLVVGLGALSWHAVAPAKQGVPAALARAAQAPGGWFAALPPAPPAAPEPALGAQVDQLLATHDPEDALAAYWLIANCETFNREHDRAVYDLEEVKQQRNMIPFRMMNDSEKQHDTRLCMGMSERMRLSRFDYLGTAVKAGLSGALIQTAEEGPFGDNTALATRPDDPLVREWKASVLSQLSSKAEDGDLQALGYLWIHELIGNTLIAKDQALAYRYAVARGLIAGEIRGPDDIEAKMFAPESPEIKSMVDLTPEQRAAELVAAQRIADKARERRQH
jgi:hypothetical protein